MVFCWFWVLRVSFLGRLVAGNRLTVPVEIRWRFRLKPGETYLVRAKVNSMEIDINGLIKLFFFIITKNYFETLLRWF